MIDLDLSGKRAVLTGASLGIGAAAVRALADQGAYVSFCSRSPDNVAALADYRPPSGDGRVQGFSADMADRRSVDGFLDAVQAEGPVDILVNNVGASPSRNFLYMSDEDWLSLFELNLMSAVRCTRRLLPAMRERKWGRVVMVSSGAALYPNPALIDYSASKAAMISIGKSLARKYGADNVLVNSVLPGLIHTPCGSGRRARWRPRTEPLSTRSSPTTPDPSRSGATEPLKRSPPSSCSCARARPPTSTARR